MAKKKASSSARRTKTASKKKAVRKKASKTTTRRKKTTRKTASKASEPSEDSAAPVESPEPDEPRVAAEPPEEVAAPEEAEVAGAVAERRSPPPARRKLTSRRGGRSRRRGGRDDHDSEDGEASDSGDRTHRSRRSRRPSDSDFEDTEGAESEGRGRSSSSSAPTERKVAARPSLGELEPPTPLQIMGKGNPPPFVVARGEDSLRVLDEALKYTGFFELLEEMLDISGKSRETFEIVAKVDLLHAEGKEEYPVSYTDPRLVRHLFDQLLDRGFRLLRVVDTRNEIARYQRNRGIKEVGRAAGYDESCYDLRDLGEEQHPVELPGALGRAATGKTWLEADCRLVFAKNRTDEVQGPALLFYNLFQTLAVPTSLIALERGMEPWNFVIAVTEALPVHFGLIDAVYSRDGSPGSGGAYDLLSDEEGQAPTGAELLRTDTIIAGRDLLAVEAAGQRMQGLDPMEDEVFRILRRNTGYKLPAEIADLPVHPGWKQLGRQIRELMDVGRPADAMRAALHWRISVLDKRLFPNLPGGWQHVRLREHARKYLEEVKREGTAEDDGMAVSDNGF